MFILLIPDGCPQDTLLWAKDPSSRKHSSGISSWFHRVWGEHSRSQCLTHRGGFAGMVFLPKPDPQLSRGQHTPLRNLKHGPSAPARAFLVPKAPHDQAGIPTGACNTGEAVPVPPWTSPKSTFGGLTASLSPSEQRREVADTSWEKRAGSEGCSSLL